MILSRAIAIIKRDMGYKQTGDSEIIDAIADAQEQLETSWPGELEMPWFLLSERSVATQAGEEERLLLPTDFIMEFEGDALWLQLEDGGEKRLWKYDADDLRQDVQRYSSTSLENQIELGRFSYALTGDYFRIFPTPTSVQSYKMIYYQRQEVMTEGSEENRWLKYAPWVLIGAAGEEMSMGSRDAAAKQHFQNKKAAGLESISSFTLARKYANRRMAMGETL
jgi:hypothetical protein